jgi:arylsulfatase A-like enzyme
VRVPFLIRWPGRIEAGKRVPQIAAAIDLLPTLADMAGIPLDVPKPLDGKSIKPLLTGSAVGATVELAFGGESVRAKVTEAHDPPLVGAEHDRVKRAESYVKSFKTLPLGVLAMEKGRGELTLRAVDIPGRKAMDVRYVMLRRLEE